jgi:peptide/nickel transport system ATP-binding protein
VSLTLGKNEIVGLVGESGCGKSTTAFSIMRLLPSAARITGGRIEFEGKNLLDFTDAEIRSTRGRELSMIFQDPRGYLNPVLTAGDQISEGIIKHRGKTKSEARASAIQMLEAVQIPSPADVAKRYPHQLSGGMCQRVMIAMALACNPKLLIADEPTTALDVTIQYEILRLITGIRKRLGISILLITHDMGVAAEICDRIYVMYAGRIIEEADVFQIFKAPKHPYTKALMASLLRADRENNKVQGIPGSVPNLMNPPPGCRFHPRGPSAMDICKEKEPLLKSPDGGDSEVACWLY